MNQVQKNHTASLCAKLLLALRLLQSPDSQEVLLGQKVAAMSQEVKRGCLCKRQPQHHGADEMRDELGWSPLQPIRMGGMVLCNMSASACARVVKWLRHEGAPQAASGWTRGFGQGPACSTKHQEVFSKHWEWGKEDQQWVNSIFRQHGSYQDRNFMSCGCGTDSNPPPMHWLHFFFYMHMYFYVDIKAYIKYPYKQLINGSSNMTCGLTSLLVPSHYPPRLELKSGRIAPGFMNWQANQWQTCQITSPSCTHRGFKEWEAWWKFLHAAGPQVGLFFFLGFLLISGCSCSERFLCITKKSEIFQF